jgi:hypothetical protein
MVAIVSGIVSSCYWCRYRLCQGFVSRCRGVRYCQKYQGVKYRRVKVLWYQGVGMHCKDTGAFVGESTLLLDFETFRQNV